jgi:murein DD-endopeptidase MepM/ murein hydrolase activator NlpD
MSEENTPRITPRTRPSRLARQAAASVMLGALVITGPWIVPAVGHEGESREAFPGPLGPLGPLALSADSYGPYPHQTYETSETHQGDRPYRAYRTFEDGDILNPFEGHEHESHESHDFREFREAPAWPALAGASRMTPVSEYPISAAYGIPGSWAAGHHTGVDFATPTGTAIRSVGPGTVVLAGYAGDYGYAVIVKMSDGYYALYAHLSEVAVEVNQWVETGAELGATGSTGRSTGPHLHFEIRTGDAYGTDVDPLAYLAGQGVSVV